MRRQRRPVELPVPGRDVDEAVARLTAVAARVRARRPRSPGDLRLRVRADGRVRAGQLSGTYTVFPVLRGRLEPAPGGGVRLAGTVRENGATLLLIAGQAMGLLGSLAVLALAPAEGETGGAVVAGVFAAAFAAITWGLQRARRSFGTDVGQLLAAVDRALGRRR